MRIDETKTYTFHFPFIGQSEMSCHVPAHSKEEAVETLRLWFEQTITDFSMEFPKISGGTAINFPTLSNDPIPKSELNILQIDHIKTIINNMALIS